MDLLFQGSEDGISPRVMADSSWMDGGASQDGPWLNPGIRHEFAGASVLLVEDDDDSREFLMTMLELDGFAPTACSSAEAALEALREQPFDLVLTDYMLPNRTGGWLLQQASAEGLIDATPVLVVTAHPRPADVAEYEIVQKPFDPDHLVSRVRQRLEGPSRRPKRSVTPPQTGSRAGNGDGEDAGGKEPVELILYVSSHSPRSAEAIQNLLRVVSRFSSDRVNLTVHDLSADPSKGLADAVFVTPTLVRRSPGPRTFVLGHITNPEIIAALVADLS
jgi:two-component system response regulator GlrR